MILPDDNHLHIDEQNPIADWLIKSMSSLPIVVSR